MRNRIKQLSNELARLQAQADQWGRSVPETLLRDIRKVEKCLELAENDAGEWLDPETGEFQPLEYEEPDLDIDALREHQEFEIAMGKRSEVATWLL